MSTAIARRSEVSDRNGAIAQSLVPPAIAFVMLLAVGAILRHSILAPHPVGDDRVDPSPAEARAAPLAAIRPAVALQADRPPPVALERAASGLPLPPGALAAARARLQVLATRQPPQPDEAAMTVPATPADLQLPPPRPALAPPSGAAAADRPAALAAYDGSTAVYEIASHTVYLPDGSTLEAHSGLGPRRDDPRSIGERMRGATPPNVYQIQALDKLFHGVRALRLNPVGDGNMFGRDGMLAHTYMLGPNGDSNGCVVFKNYKAFLKAWDDGMVKKLVVVPRLS